MASLPSVALITATNIIIGKLNILGLGINILEYLLLLAKFKRQIKNFPLSQSFFFF